MKSNLLDESKNKKAGSSNSRLLEEGKNPKATFTSFKKKVTQLGPRAKLGAIATIALMVTVILLFALIHARKNRVKGGSYLQASDLTYVDGLGYVYWHGNRPFIFANYDPEVTAEEGDVTSQCGDYEQGENDCPRKSFFCFGGAAWSVSKTEYEGETVDLVTLTWPTCWQDIMATTSNTIIWVDWENTYNKASVAIVAPLGGIDTSSVTKDSDTWPEDLANLVLYSEAYVEYLAGRENA